MARRNAKGQRGSFRFGASGPSRAATLPGSFVAFVGVDADREREESVGRVHRPGAVISSRRPAMRPNRGTALAVGVAFVALCFGLAARLNIYQDEWYSLRTTSRDLGFALANAIGFEGIPPLYPLVLDAWRHVDGSVLFARALSIACVGATAWLAAAFARRRLPHVSPLAVAAAIAFNPFSIYAALEIRLYAMAMLGSVALVASFYDAFVDDGANLRRRIVFVLVCVASVYVEYFEAALIVGGALALVVLGRMRALRAYVAAGLIVALACAPIATFLGGQLETARSLDAHHLALAPLLETALSFALPHDAFANWFADRRTLIYDAGLLVAVVAIVRAGPRATEAVRVLGSFVLAGLAFYPTATIVLHQTFFYPRHAVILIVPVLLAIFATLDGLSRDATFATRAYLAVYAACTLAGLASTYRGLAKPGDFARAAQYLRAHARPNQPIFAFDQEMAGPLGFYDPGGTIVPLPQPQTFDRFDSQRFRFHSVAEVRDRIGRIRSGTHVLLYRGDVCYDRADPFGCRFLEDVVRTDFRTLDARDLDSANVRELVRR